MVKKIFASFFGNKETLTAPSYCTDIHSHLLPGIDDGVKTLEESIDIITSLHKMGFSRLVVTPHIMYHHFRNTKEIIEEQTQKLNDALRQAGIDVEIIPSAEYYFDENFLHLIEKEELLPFGNDRYVLFEMSYTNRPFGLEQTIFTLLSKGYKPILAHPERYSFLNSDVSKFEQLKHSGVRFQLNINSLIGFYGKKPRVAAKYLVENGLIDFVGSDIHAQRYLESFQKALGTKQVRELFEKNQIKNDYIF